jgi:hypothetical protein
MANVPISNLTTTWNNVSTTFTGIKLNVTDTASAAGSLLMDLQVGGASRFNVTKAGVFQVGGNSTTTIESSSGYVVISGSNGIIFNAAANVGINTAGIKCFSTGGIGFTSGNGIAAFDTSLFRDAANTLAQRNGVNAQTFRLYNTFTDVSNYERGFMRWNTNVLEIGAEAAGTGTLRSTAFSANAAASTPPVAFTGTWFTGGTSTTTKPQVVIEPTGTTSTNWSTAGTGFGVNATSGFTGNLLDLQVNGGRHFRVASTGSGSTVEIYVQAGFTNEGLSIGASNQSPKTKLSLSDGLFFSGTSDYDVCLRADGVANTIALRRTTNAQTFRVYGTFTDASNYRRLTSTMSTGGVAEIKPEGAGTGVSGNVLHISGLPTSNPGPGILWNNLGIVNVGT